MSIIKTALKQLRAFAEKCCMDGGGAAIRARRNAVFTLAAIGVVLVSRPATESPLSSAISDLDNAVTTLSTTSAGLNQDVTSLIANYKLTNAGKCALLVVGLSSTNSTAIYFVPGPTPISGFNADIMNVDSISVTGVMAGLEAGAAGKGVSSSAIPNGRRFVLVGFNQNVIGPGDMAMVMLDTSKAAPGNHVLSLTNFVATDPNGSAVPLCATTGVITK